MSRKIDLSKMEYTPALAIELAHIIKARFIEAVDVSMHLPRDSIARNTGFWPSYFLDYPRDKVQRYRPNSHAIFRQEQCWYEWLTCGPFFSNEDCQMLLAYVCSICSRSKFGSFKDFTDKKGINRRTAERKIEQIFQNIAEYIHKSGELLHLPDFERVSLLVPKWGNKQIHCDGILFERSIGAVPKLKTGEYDIRYV